MIGIVRPTATASVSAAMATDKGHATISAAAVDCVTRLTAKGSPGWCEVLIQPLLDGGTPWVASDTLEAVIRLESVRRTPPIVWDWLHVELKSMRASEGTTLIAEGYTRT